MIRVMGFYDMWYCRVRVHNMGYIARENGVFISAYDMGPGPQLSCALITSPIESTEATPGGTWFRVPRAGPRRHYMPW